jgi:5-deoxy-glucuronate isomerase
MMSKLLVSPSGTHGRVHHITPSVARWTHVGFDLYRLIAGDTVGEETGEREVCIVFIAGRGRVWVSGVDFGEQGGRDSPFDGRPHALYVPANQEWSVTATGACEVAVCSAPSKGTYPVRLIGPDDVTQEVRGKGSNTRFVTNILPENQSADSLLVVEVITPGGNTSSFPPHRHDRNDLPRETVLEETYFHRFKLPQGFAFQRIYSDDRSLDEAIAVEDRDVTLVPGGYHPVAAIHGYDLYYLNVMAGPVRTWKFHDSVEHAWVLNK